MKLENLNREIAFARVRSAMLLSLPIAFVGAIHLFRGFQPQDIPYAWPLWLLGYVIPPILIASVLLAKEPAPSELAARSSKTSPQRAVEREESGSTRKAA